jgi:cytoskeleton protein RodZ
MGGERLGEMPIGEVLKAARVRAGLDLAAVEERTKIRVRYLRALEEERWDELPSTAYGKGFLRTYAELLGLDPEALVDEYRRQVEADVAPVESGAGPRIGLLIGVGAGIALGIVVLIALVGGDDVSREPRAKPVDEPRAGGRRDGGEGGTVELALKIREPVAVCLVGGGGEALIDGQVLAAGDRERFERRRFELRFPSGFDPGQLTVRVAGSARRLPRANGPATYELSAPRHITLAAHAPGERCP